MRVLFWGTPEFAAAPLRALIGEGFQVMGVVSQPDKPRGRSRSVEPTPVKRIALDENIPCFQPESPRDPEFADVVAAMRPDISVVVAYGQILPRRMIDLPQLGTLNIHASLLPALRGAAPIQAAIRQGDAETGVSIMRMVPALDSGPVILRARVPLLDDETYGELQVRLSELGAVSVLEALTLISVGEAREEVQDESLATYAPKVTREDARIDWSLSAVEVGRTIHAYDPQPGAFTTLHGVEVKMFGARVMPARLTDEMHSGSAAGAVLAAEGGLVVACGEGVVRVLDVHPAGKKRLSSAEWARGRGVSVGDRLGG